MIVKDIEGKCLTLTKRFLNEAPFRSGHAVKLSEIKRRVNQAHKKNANGVPVYLLDCEYLKNRGKEERDWVGSIYFHGYSIGCRQFDFKTFYKILKASGINAATQRWVKRWK